MTKNYLNKRKLGAIYEDKACAYLSDLGYEILDRNFRSYKGEIDIIAKDAECLVFVEVKYRAKNSFGYSAEAVNIHKQKIIYRVAESYISLHHQYNNRPCRFDVIAFEQGDITHYINAFGGL